MNTAPNPSKLAENRADFVKRIFAVTVSVGFASQLVQLHWVKAGTLPMGAEWRDFGLLCLALFLVVQSWEGYLLAIQNKPLERPWRFYLDISLVFMYLSLLVTSKNQTAFLFIVVLIFVVYIFWDCISFFEFFEKDGYPDSSLASYFRGLLGPGRRRLTTIVYCLFSVELFLLQYLAGPIYLPIFFVSVISILVGYRLDKNHPGSIFAYALLLIPLGVLLAYQFICI